MIKKILIPILLVIFSFSLSAQEVLKKKNGLYKKKYANGKMQETGMVENHLRTGEWKNYNFQGQLVSSYTYTKGLRNGPFTNWYGNGNKMNEGTYTNEKLTGEWKRYSPDGNIRELITYGPDGKEKGLQCKWESDKRLIYQAFFGENGYIETVFYFPNGRIRQRRREVNGQKEGEQKDFAMGPPTQSNDSFLVKIEHYHHDTLEGIQQRFDGQAHLLEEAFFVHGKNVGYQRTWENGKLKDQSYYPCDTSNIHYVNYFGGKKSEEGTYVNGKLEGLQMHYDPELCYNWYKNDQMDSCRCFTKTNKLRLRYEMVDPKQQITRGIEYDSLGKKHSDWLLKHNDLEGDFHTYYPNGKLKNSFTYHHNAIIGNLNAWSPSGKKVIAVVIDSNEIVSQQHIFSDAGVELKKGTAAYEDQLKKYLPSAFRLDNNWNITAVWEEEPPQQLIEEPEKQSGQGEIFSYAEQMPEFSGGEMAFMDYLMGNLQYPEEEKQNGIEGVVYVSFVVEKDGSISNCKVVKSVERGPGLSKEALRLVQQMPPWQPGKMNNHPVRVEIVQPIRFRLNQ